MAETERESIRQWQAEGIAASKLEEKTGVTGQTVSGRLRVSLSQMPRQGVDCPRSCGFAWHEFCHILPAFSEVE